MLGYLFVHALGEVSGAEQPAEISRSWIDEWLLGKIIARALVDWGLDEGEAWSDVSLVKILTANQGWWKAFSKKPGTTAELYLFLQGLLKDSEVQRWIGVNRYQGTLWYNKESFEGLVWWLFVGAILDILAEAPATHEKTPEEEEELVRAIKTCFQVVEKLFEAEAVSNFQVEKLLEATK
jgi:hypothetical protein